MKVGGTITCIAFALSLGAWAQPSAAPTPEDLQKQIQALQQQMQQMMQGYQSQIDELKQLVAELKAQQVDAVAREQAAAQGPEAPNANPPSAPSAPATPSAPPSPGLTNPAISLIPDFTYSGGSDPYWKEGGALQVREVEVAFSANIDPYASAFAALSWSQGKFEVEEAYGSFPSLPGGWTMKLGKFYADFGKQNQMHTHAWFQADQPLAERVMIGPDGWGDVGVSVTHLLPTPWMSDLTLQAGGGGPEKLFGGQPSDISYLMAWRNFWDLNDNSNLEAQLSIAGGKNPTGHGTGMGNLAFTYRYKPQGVKSHLVLWRTELITDQYRTPDGVLHSAGGFTYVDWQFTRGWFLGGRADYAEHPLAPSLHDKGGALVLTWMPSEFQRFRLQYERTDYAGLGPRDALVFEYGFSLGPHGAHPF